MKVIKYTFLVIILAFSIAIQGFSQDPEYLIQQDSFINRTPINSIIVDLNNNKWIGTENELIKINDYETEMKKIKAVGVATSIIGENEKGWLCTYDNKISMFDKEVSYSTNVTSNEIITTMGVEGNFFWLGTSNGLYKISLKSRKDNKSYFEKNSKLPSNRINDIMVEESGRKWIATEEGLVELKGKRWKVHFKKNNITALALHKGHILAAGDGKIWRLPKSRDWEELALPDQMRHNPIESMTYDHDGNLWVAAGILGRLDKNWIPSIYGEEEGFTSLHPTILAVDHRNNVWVGTAGKGVFKVNKIENDQPMAFADNAPTPTPSIEKKKKAQIAPILSSGGSSAKTGDISAVTNQMFAGKAIKPGREIEVSETRIKIALWNPSTSPNDVVSVYYNGKLIIKEYVMTKNRKVISLRIKKNKPNQLVLVSHTKNTAQSKMIKVAMLHKDAAHNWMTLVADSQFGDQINFKYSR